MTAEERIKGLRLALNVIATLEPPDLADSLLTDHDYAIAKVDWLRRKALQALAADDAAVAPVPPAEPTLTNTDAPQFALGAALRAGRASRRPDVRMA